jgi:hypothetical protein
MKITFKISGGFAYLPALSDRSIVIDTTQIDPQVASRLESLVSESHFFGQPVHTESVAKGAADYLTYIITVQNGSNVHTVQLTDPIMDANLEQLVSYLQVVAPPSVP